MKKLWIRVNSSDEVEGVKKYISSMPKEGFHGDIPICVYAIAGKTIHKLDGDYSVSESAIDALEGRYGEKMLFLQSGKILKIYTQQNLSIFHHWKELPMLWKKLAATFL